MTRKDVPKGKKDHHREDMKENRCKFQLMKITDSIIKSLKKTNVGSMELEINDAENDSDSIPNQIDDP